MKKISVITPIFNEEESIPHLVNNLLDVFKGLKFQFEIIAVNDGSKDKSEEVLSKFAKKIPELKVINFSVNRGQSAALSAGIEKATGEIIITMDSDLENNPKDIPILVNKLEEGFDVVSGWRKMRWEGKFFSRKLPSVLANKLISYITGVKLHDYGCILKAYTRNVISGVHLYGEMHRFIPAYAYWNGARITEIEVGFSPRKFGKSNYGFMRTFRVLLDLIVIKYFAKYMNKPMHFFGGLGMFSLFFGSTFGLLAIVLKILDLRSFVATPLPIWSALFIIVGVQLMTMGVVAEIVMRTYYESQGKTPYKIKNTINF